MATRVEVPGQGIVEFPDGMDDAAIAAAIKKAVPTPQNPTDYDAYYRSQGLTPNAAGTEYTKAATNLATKAVEPITSYPAAESRIAHEAWDTLKQGVSDLRPQVMGGPKGKTASGIWDTATGAMRYTGAPVEAGLETIVGKPFQENFGIPEEWSKFAAGLAIPYYGLRGGPVQTGAKKIFTPETVSPKAEEAAGLIRGEQGQAARSTQSSMAAVEPYHPAVNALDDPGRLDLYRYIEGRSKQPTAAEPPPAAPRPMPEPTGGPPPGQSANRVGETNVGFGSASMQAYRDTLNQPQTHLDPRPRGTAAAGDYTLGAPEPRGTAGDTFVFKLTSPDGRVGQARIKIEGDTAHIESVGIPGESNTIGSVGMRSLLRQFQQQFPNVRLLTGDRTSGARGKGSEFFAGEPVEVPLSAPKETASKLTPELRKLADTLRDGLKKRRMDLESLDKTAEMNFVTDYFPHMWKDPKKAQDFLASFGARAKEGSGRNLKARTIPTIEDGLNAGLELKTTNPLDAYQAYITNMDRFIATERVFEKAKELGSVQKFEPGQQPAGWMEVKSRLNQGPNKYYAPEDWARIYNNFTSRGFAELGPEFGSAYQGARMASNAVTALELSLSGYHALTMGQEAIVNEVARSIQQGARGSPVAALWTAAKAPLAPFTLARQGSKAQKVYLGTTMGTPEQKAVVDILTEAGARFKGRAHAADLGSSAAGSFFDAWRKGSLKTELLSDWRDMKGAPVKGTAGVIARNVGRAMDTIMHPLFQSYIPKLKNGAAYENMADWLRANPGATKDEQLKMARQIVDSIDNRFGEMIQDNIFWNQMLKQISMLGMRSYSWNLGTVREIAGGATDVLGGKGFTQRAAYNIALPIVYGMTGATYQYLKTGQPPQDMQDYIAPRTGGTDPKSGLPERITPPGYMKDVLGWAGDPRQEAVNKFATAPRLAGEMLFKGTDWRGDPIAPPGTKDAPLPDNVPIWLKAYFEHVAEAMGPISVKNAMQGAKRGSNLSSFERVLGLQPSGMAKTDPAGFERMMRGIEERRWKNKLRHDENQKNQFGGPVE